jgi:hypothetical protein
VLLQRGAHQPWRKATPLLLQRSKRVRPAGLFQV